MNQSSKHSLSTQAEQPQAGVEESPLALLDLLDRALALLHSERASELALLRGLTDLFRNSLHCLDLLAVKHGEADAASDLSWPSYEGISSLVNFIRSAEQSIIELPGVGVLKRKILDALLLEQQEPESLLQDLGKRLACELALSKELFLPFSLGELRPLVNGQFLVSWGCYDFVSGLPYLHTLKFEWQGQPASLDDPLPVELQERVRTAIKKEGGRAPQLGVLAVALDEADEALHPKELRRIQLRHPFRLADPFVAASSTAVDGSRVEPDSFAEILAEFKKQVEQRESHLEELAQLALIPFVEEIVVSRSQEESRSLLTGRVRRRESFLIAEREGECAQRRVSAVGFNLLLPHRLAQRFDRQGMAARNPALLDGLKRSRIFAYDSEGIVYGV